MKTITNLTRIYTNSLFTQSFNSNSKKNKKYNIAIIALIISLVVCAGMGYAYYSLAESFNAIGKPQMILLIGLIGAGIFVLFFTVYQQQGVYFKTNDYEYLESLPIKKIEIVIAKFVSCYILSFFYHSIFLFPAYVVYFIFNSITAEAIIYAIFSFIFAPAFINFIGNIISIIINLLTAKVKNKNIVTSILTLFFTIFLVLSITLASNETFTNLFSNEEISIWIQVFLPYATTLFYSITSNSFVQYLLFILISIFAIIISITLLTITYKKLNLFLLQSDSKVKTTKKQEVYKEQSVFKDLFCKEFKLFVNTPVYFVNCIMGAIMTVAISIILALSFKNYEEIKNVAFAIFTFVNLMMIGTAIPSSVSINVEGEKNYIVKSLPIPFKTIALSKIMFSIVLYLPFVIVSNILFPALLGINNFLIISLSALLQLITLIENSLLGFLINLRFHNLKWINMTQAVNQSLSTFICLIINFAIAIIPLITGFILGEKLYNNLVLTLIILISTIVYILILIISLIVLKNKGQKMFDKI